MTLAHDLDLARFAPLVPEQIYHLIRAVHSHGDRAGRHRDEIAAYVNDRCVDAARLDADAVARHLSTIDEVCVSQFEKYSLWAQTFPDRWITFMNYGVLASEELPLTDVEAIWPHATALYDHIARLEDLRGRDVLEVGAGRGGGAAYIARVFQPRALVATDGTRSNVLAARAAHEAPNLEVRHAFAEQLPFEDASFDAVINVESCKYYRPISAFLIGARRVLRPGGVLVVAVFGAPEVIQQIRRASEACGFDCEAANEITSSARAAVVASRRTFPAILERLPTVRARRHYREYFEGLYATDVFERRTVYVTFRFRRGRT